MLSLAFKQPCRGTSRACGPAGAQVERTFCHSLTTQHRQLPACQRAKDIYFGAAFVCLFFLTKVLVSLGGNLNNIFSVHIEIFVFNGESLTQWVHSKQRYHLLKKFHHTVSASLFPLITDLQLLFLFLLGLTCVLHLIVCFDLFHKK